METTWVIKFPYTHTYVYTSREWFQYKVKFKHANGDLNYVLYTDTHLTTICNIVVQELKTQILGFI